MTPRVAAMVLGVALMSAPADAQDQIDLARAHIIASSPQDIASWPIDGLIRTIRMRPGSGEGLSFEFDQRATWPNYRIPGWDGDLQYTVWACVSLGGEWHCGGFIQMWRERQGTGAPILRNWSSWAYDNPDGRYGQPMDQYRPKPGDLMGFFLSQGNARYQTTPSTIRARTPVVLVALPANDTGVFEFSGTSPEPPPPNPNPTPGWNQEFHDWAIKFGAWAAVVRADLDAQSEALTLLRAQVTDLRAASDLGFADQTKQHEAMRQEGISAGDVGKFLVKYGPIVALVEELLRRYVVQKNP